MSVENNDNSSSHEQRATSLRNRVANRLNRERGSRDSNRTSSNTGNTNGTDRESGTGNESSDIDSGDGAARSESVSGESAEFGAIEFDPTESTSGDGISITGGTKRGRGRPAGSRNRSSRGNDNTDNEEASSYSTSTRSNTITFNDVADATSTGKKRGRPRRKASEVEAVALAKGFQLIYSLPVMFGYGEHWEIDRPDAQLLSESFLEAAGNVESKYFKQFMKLFSEVVPWLAFIFVLITITKPRLEKTARMMNDTTRKETENPTNVNAYPRPVGIANDVAAHETTTNSASQPIN